MGDEVCVEQPVGDDICYAPPAQEEQAPIETLDPSVTECDPNQNASGAQDPGPQVTKQPTADDAVDTIRALQNDPQGTSENGAKALDAMNELPTDKKLEAIDQMDRDEVDRFANELPAERRTELKEMAEKCTDPEKKLQLWAKYHAGQAVADADTKNAEGGTDKQAERRTQAANETDSEMSEDRKSVV